MAGPVIHAWVGAGFPESVLVTQILLMVVLIRVGNASAALILKGGGQHRMLAFVNSATAIVNVVMSVLLVPVLGLVGVAVGTLVPVGFTALAVLYPAACRRVGTPVSRGYARAVWPAIWSASPGSAT
jgi:O-antigen/teichoic acid export membrane protein